VVRQAGARGRPKVESVAPSRRPILANAKAQAGDLGFGFEPPPRIELGTYALRDQVDDFRDLDKFSLGCANTCWHLSASMFVSQPLEDWTRTAADDWWTGEVGQRRTSACASLTGLV
jgi:hypothetical protein